MSSVTCTTNELMIALHLCDSAFPGGTLASSQGLESAIQHGFVSRNNSESLWSFIHQSLEQVRYTFETIIDKILNKITLIG